MSLDLRWAFVHIHKCVGSPRPSESCGPLPGAGKSCDILWAPLGVADSPRLPHRPEMRTPPFSTGVHTHQDFTASGKWTEDLWTPTGLSPRQRARVGSGSPPPFRPSSPLRMLLSRGPQPEASPRGLQGPHLQPASDTLTFLPSCSPQLPSVSYRHSRAW